MHSCWMIVEEPTCWVSPPDVVVVEAEHPLGVGLFEPVLQRPRLPHPSLRQRGVGQESEARIPRRGVRHERPRAVGGVAVHHEDLVHHRPLPHHPLEAGTDARHFIERSDHDCDLPGATRTGRRELRGAPRPPAGEAGDQHDQSHRLGREDEI